MSEKPPILPHDLNRVCSALAALDANCNRKDWMTIAGMLAKACAWMQVDGLPIFLEWSRTAQKFKSERDARSVWIFVHKDQPQPTPRPLFALAQMAGWQNPGSQPGSQPGQAVKLPALPPKETNEQRELRELRAAERAREICQKRERPPMGHTYLIKKQMELGASYPQQPLLARGYFPVFPADQQFNDSLIVPRYFVQDDGRPVIMSCEAITTAGAKRSLQYSRAEGTIYPIGNVRGHQGRIWVCEGLATALAVHIVTGAPCVVAFSIYNIPAAVERVRIIASDAEIWAAGETGTEGIAAAIAEQTGVRFVFPPMPQKGADFHDFAALHGLDETRKTLETE